MQKKGPEIFEKSKMLKNNQQNSENIIFAQSTQWATYVPNLKNSSWFMRPWLQKNKFDLLLAVN